MSDFKYFGDDWFEFHDFLNSMSISEQIGAQINAKVEFILPNELAYYTKTNQILLNTLKCVREINKEKDESKHNDILLKYKLKPVDIKKPDYLN